MCCIGGRNKMIINTEIIDFYLENRNLESIKNHWIFNAIVPGKYSFDEPKNIKHNQLIQLYQIVKERLIHFQPLNQSLWKEVFGEMQIPDTTIVYLMVGSPKPYDAMVRKDEEGNFCILLDLVRICDYSEDVDKLKEIACDFITHELAHVLVGQQYPYSENLTEADFLIQLVFDEGISHFLSHQEDVLSVEWDSLEMKKRRQKSYEKICYYLKHEEELTDEVYIKANSGVFWEKFAAIGGMFAVLDYYRAAGSFNELLAQGPSSLLPFIKEGMAE